VSIQLHLVPKWFRIDLKSTTCIQNDLEDRLGKKTTDFWFPVDLWYDVLIFKDQIYSQSGPNLLHVHFPFLFPSYYVDCSCQWNDESCGIVDWLITRAKWLTKKLCICTCMVCMFSHSVPIALWIQWISMIRSFTRRLFVGIYLATHPDWASNEMTLFDVSFRYFSFCRDWRACN